MHRHGPGMSFGSFLPVMYGGGYGASTGGGIGGVLVWVVAAAILFGVVTSFLDNRNSDAPLISECLLLAAWTLCRFCEAGRSSETLLSGVFSLISCQITPIFASPETRCKESN